MDAELAWACGFFEGEGSIFCKRGKRGTFNRSVVVANTDLSCLERFRAALGVGHILGPYQRGNGWKDQWMWRCRGYDEQVEAIRLMWPMLSERRREQARVLLSNPAQKGKGGRQPNHELGQARQRESIVMPAWARS